LSFTALVVAVHVVEPHRQSQFGGGEAADRSSDVELGDRRVVLGGNELRLRREQQLTIEMRRLRPRSEPTRWRNQQLGALSGWYLTPIQASSIIVVRRPGFRTSYRDRAPSSGGSKRRQNLAQRPLYSGRFLDRSRISGDHKRFSLAMTRPIYTLT
jgi:hypothetical protein